MFNARGDFRCLSLMVTFLLAFAFFSGTVYALGLSYGAQYLSVDEGGTGCVTYKVFNSGNNGIEVEAMASSDFDDLTVDTGGALNVPAGTPLSSAVLVDVCFDVPSGVYSGSCPESLIRYEGNVNFVQAPDAGDGGVSGSTATVSAAAPLVIEVSCIESDGLSLGLIYPILAVLIIIVIIILLIVRRKQGDGMQMSNVGSG